MIGSLSFQNKASGKVLFRGNPSVENYASFQRKNPGVILDEGQQILVENLLGDPFGSMHTDQAKQNELTSYGAEFVRRLYDDRKTEPILALFQSIHQNPSFQLSQHQQRVLDQITLQIAKPHQDTSELTYYSNGVTRFLAIELSDLKTTSPSAVIQPFKAVQDHLKGLLESLETQKAILSEHERIKLTSCLNRAEAFVGKLQHEFRLDSNG